MLSSASADRVNGMIGSRPAARLPPKPPMPLRLCTTRLATPSGTVSHVRRSHSVPASRHRPVPFGRGPAQPPCRRGLIGSSPRAAQSSAGNSTSSVSSFVAQRRPSPHRIYRDAVTSPPPVTENSFNRFRLSVVARARERRRERARRIFRRKIKLFSFVSMLSDRRKQ